MSSIASTYPTISTIVPSSEVYTQKKLTAFAKDFVTAQCPTTSAATSASAASMSAEVVNDVAKQVAKQFLITFVGAGIKFAMTEVPKDFIRTYIRPVDDMHLTANLTTLILDLACPGKTDPVMLTSFVNLFVAAEPQIFALLSEPGDYNLNAHLDKYNLYSSKLEMKLESDPTRYMLCADLKVLSGKLPVCAASGYVPRTPAPATAQATAPKQSGDMHRTCTGNKHKTGCGQPFIVSAGEIAWAEATLRNDSAFEWKPPARCEKCRKGKQSAATTQSAGAEQSIAATAQSSSTVPKPSVASTYAAKATSAPATKPAPKPATKPAAKPAPKPAAKPEPKSTGVLKHNEDGSCSGVCKESADQGKTKCGKAFSLTSEEVKAYSEKNIPLPLRCGDCRTARRLAREAASAPKTSKPKAKPTPDAEGFTTVLRTSESAAEVNENTELATSDTASDATSDGDSE